VATLQGGEGKVNQKRQVRNGEPELYLSLYYDPLMGTSQVASILPGVDPHDERRQNDQSAGQGEKDVDHSHYSRVLQDDEIRGYQQRIKSAVS